MYICIYVCVCVCVCVSMVPTLSGLLALETFRQIRINPFFFFSFCKVRQAILVDGIGAQRVGRPRDRRGTFSPPKTLQ